ncbi:hypothetical protein [Runella zeae]|uniref:hypothetical protein n=1 Tax=Runella zeae TaxID=94255 RepID=UPI000412F68B|nr:hypothetical protein [Runella zeae]
MNEDKILEAGFVKHYKRPAEIYTRQQQGKTIWSGRYCLPEHSSFLSSNLEICVETLEHKGTTRYYGKLGAQRMPLNNDNQLNVFLALALEI